MEIITPRKKDLPEILDLVSACTQKMQSEGNFQWYDEYPTPEILTKDIEDETLFIVNHNDKIIGILALTYNEEVQYKDIQWQDKDGRALEIHRMGVHPKCQGQGVGKKLFDFTEEYAKENGYTSIRMDTYCQNKKMIELVEIREYKKTGEIFFPPLEPPFYCYEKLLSSK
jgi:ribosomal protein S18 acetylase RimI-like enzyme